MDNAKITNLFSFSGLRFLVSSFRPPVSTFWSLVSRAAGQSTLEILIAFAVIAISLSAIAVVISSSQSLLADTQESNRAVNLARQSIENSIAFAKNDFGGLVSSSSTQGEFLKEIIVENVDANKKKITSRVSWSTDPLRIQKIELTTIVTNWQVNQATGGDTSGGGVTGDWKNPTTFGSIDLGPGESATGLDVINKIIYMSATASDRTKPDFFIINATDGRNPYLVSKIDTGPGLNAVDAVQNYAYVANSDTNAQLQVIDMNNPAAPYVLASFKLPGVSGSGAMGQSLFFYNNKIYIGTKAASGPEFHVVDVSNPAAPSEFGSYEVGADVNDIFVSGTTAYLATSDDSKELLILDVSDPAHIAQLGSFNASGNDDGKSIYISGAKAYLGRAGGTSDFIIIDVSNSSSPTQLGIANLGNVSVNGIYVTDYLAFLATSDTNKEFQAWNISTSSAPSLWSSYNFPNVGTGIDYEDNFVYVSVRSNDAFRIITSSQ